MPPKSYTSKIWQYFGFKAGDTEKKFAFCSLCDAKLKYCRNTTNLFTHFKSQHPLVYAKSELSQQKYVAEESCSTSRVTRGREREDDSQRMLIETFQTSAILIASSRRAKDITNAIGYFVVKDKRHQWHWVQEAVACARAKICYTTQKNFY